MNRRYLIVLLWHWSIPFVLGVCVGAALLFFQLAAVGPELEAAFETAIGSYCGAKQ
ncbi:hypothetical protein PSEUDT2_02515 [Stutzerimonas stutzeri]|uniref:hypothetical protein n=1 Tax=Stutzerimonas stutzeri TaxID=316 RepID=UPI00164540F9|nr:hypothetical protein [Stutzerimonas stutzeri]CAD2251275.1 hypothetical protein PSEUDT2PL_00028 [Stutzerimonas stutzeri]CAD2267446.1 hypothetical protein PSEUDT2_02515 [Stutzerimonas stutzeri]